MRATCLRRRFSASSAKLTRPASPSCPPVERYDVSLINGSAVCISLTNPARRNALSSRTLHLLRDEIRNVKQSSARALIIRAEGPVFCSGHDLKEMLLLTEQQRRECFALSAEIMQALQDLPQPVVAEVGSLATAAGVQLVASCDVVIASTEASFATPGVKIGLFCSTPAVAISRSMRSSRRALEMLLTGEPISAQEALEQGLVNRVVHPSNLQEATQQFVQLLLTNSFAVTALGKKVFYRQQHQPVEEAYKMAVDGMVENICNIKDATTGIAAFVGKTKAVWSHV